MNYKHTQTGSLIIVIFIIITLYFGWILTQTGFKTPIIAMMLFIDIILISFASLNVVIDSDYLRIKFGYGIYKRRFLLKKIISVKTVKNHWYYGWGIRFWFWPRMIIYNVSGYDAIEIKMENGKIYRIGTDEVKNLESAIMQAIK